MEIWKKIKKFKGDYEISNQGRIRSTDRKIERSNGWIYTRKGKILTPSKKGGGYFKGAVCIDKKMVSYKIHRLVAETFIPNPENKPEVNHIDGNKTNNNVYNLEWCTRKENIRHCIDNKLQTPFFGEQVGNSILKESDVLYIRKNFKPRVYTRKKLADKFGVSEATIKDVLSRKSWKHLP